MTSATDTHEPYWDPYDYDIDANPHPVWRRLRDEAPVYWNEQYGFYAVSRFADVLDVSLDTDTFINGRGTVIELMDHPLDEPIMLFMDPPEHTRMRKLVSRAFTPRRIGQLEESIRALCDRMLGPYVGAGGFDYVAEFGAQLPVVVISTLLGAPEEDWDQLRVWADLSLHREPGETMPSKKANKAQRDVQDYWQGQIERRRRQPTDDLMSELIAAEKEEADGATRHLTDSELHAFYGLLSAAGNETTSRLLGWTAVTLAAWPEERAKLVADSELVPNAVEELLRYDAPSPVQARWVARPWSRHGVDVPAESKMVLLTGSAGRDDREYEDSDRFDVTRKLRHVSFGYGIHFCVGAALARLEARIAIEETLARFPRWEVDPDAVEMVHTSTVRGPAHVPITYS